MIKAKGLAFSDLESKSAPAFKKIPTSSLVIFPAVTNTLKHITNIKDVLSLSKRPLLTYLYTWKVKYLIIISTLLDGN